MGFSLNNAPKTSKTWGDYQKEDIQKKAEVKNNLLNNEPRYNAETEAAMEEARQIISGEKKAKRSSSAAEAFDELEEKQTAKTQKKTTVKKIPAKKSAQKTSEFTKDGRKKQKPGPKPGNRKSSFSVYTTTEVVNALDEWASERNLSRAELTHEIVKEALKNNGKMK